MMRYHSVYVGCLPTYTTESDLEELFSGCGDVGEVCVRPAHAGARYTYGFVRYVEEDAADLAIKMFHGWPRGSMKLIVQKSTQAKGTPARRDPPNHRHGDDNLVNAKLLKRTLVSMGISVEAVVDELNQRELGFADYFKCEKSEVQLDLNELDSLVREMGDDNGNNGSFAQESNMITVGGGMEASESSADESANSLTSQRDITADIFSAGPRKVESPRDLNTNSTRDSNPSTHNKTVYNSQERRVNNSRESKPDDIPTKGDIDSPGTSMSDSPREENVKNMDIGQQGDSTMSNNTHSTTKLNSNVSAFFNSYVYSADDVSNRTGVDSQGDAGLNNSQNQDRHAQSVQSPHAVDGKASTGKRPPKLSIGPRNINTSFRPALPSPPIKRGIGRGQQLLQEFSGLNVKGTP